MDKKTTKFGTSDAIIITDLSLKNKIIDFLFDSIDLSNYRYNMLNNIQRLQFLKENEHYVTPNFADCDYPKRLALDRLRQNTKVLTVNIAND